MDQNSNGCLNSLRVLKEITDWPLFLTWDLQQQLGRDWVGVGVRPAYTDSTPNEDTGCTA